MGFDIGRLQWSDELLGFVGLTPSSFSEPRPSGTVVGKLDAAHARALSLEPGVAVTLGGHDQPCGAFGAGAVEPGCAVISAGSYECVTLVTDGPKNGAVALHSSLNSYPHVVSGKYVVLGFFPSGIALDWLVGSFFMRDPADETERQDALALVQHEAEMLSDEPTGICMTPHILGSGNPYWDIRATVSVSGIRPRHGRYHVVKAHAEGVACELATNLRVLDEVAGPVTRCIIHGGGSRWDCGVRLRADVTGRSLERMADPEMACRGAALLAGVGAGVYRGFADAVKGTRLPAEIFAPRADAAQRYAAQVRLYAALYEGLARYRSLDACDGAPVPGAAPQTAREQTRR
jgi:xylulokinase